MTRELSRIIVGLVVGIAVLCPLGPASCPVAASAEGKVGYVNLGKVFDSYERTKASDTALEKRGKQKDAELEARMGELKKIRQNLELLNDDAREAKTRDIEEKTEELQRFRTNTARDLRRERDKIAKDILGEIERGLDEYAKAKGFSMILDSRSLLYADAAYDVTDDIVKTLNSRLKAAAP